MRKLADIQKELNVSKKHYNSFGDFYYRNAEDIVEAVKPLLDEDDVFFISDVIENIGDRFYIKSTVRFNEHTATGYAREVLEKTKMDAPQITGTASSYARKYALGGLFALDDFIDADTQKKGNKVKGKKTATEKKKQYLSYLECLKKVTTKDMYNQVKDKKESWISWTKENYTIEYSNQIESQFNQLEERFK